MTIKDAQEYTTPDGGTISIQLNVERGLWEVASWERDTDECRWYKEFKSEAEARAEYERFR